jgi:hypothetical protein
MPAYIIIKTIAAAHIAEGRSGFYKKRQTLHIFFLFLSAFNSFLFFFFFEKQPAHYGRGGLLKDNPQHRGQRRRAGEKFYPQGHGGAGIVDPTLKTRVTCLARSAFPKRPMIFPQIKPVAEKIMHIPPISQTCGFLGSIWGATAAALAEITKTRQSLEKGPR